VQRFETPPGKQAQVDWGYLCTLSKAVRMSVIVASDPANTLI
jgi:transposase